MKRSGTTAVVYLVLVFLSGALVGGFGHRLYTQGTVIASSKSGRSTDEYRKRYTGEMRSRLKLDEAQVAKLNEVLDSTRLQYKKFNEAHRAELGGIQDDQVTKVNGFLTDSQRLEYEKMRAERQKNRK
ncbi:MAG: hypothetical protein EXQ52_16345 [Bryobacterales bacterium]|nr:hypothetical protein [Bryobacterales bacterium]